MSTRINTNPLPLSCICARDPVHLWCSGLGWTDSDITNHVMFEFLGTSDLTRGRKRLSQEESHRRSAYKCYRRNSARESHRSCSRTEGELGGLRLLLLPSEVLCLYILRALKYSFSLVVCINPQLLTVAPLTCPFNALATRIMHHDEQVTYPEIRFRPPPILDLNFPISRPPRAVNRAFRESLPNWRGPDDLEDLLPVINGGPGSHDQTASTPNENILQGARLWSLIGGLFLAVYMVGLDLSMLSTVGSIHQRCR